MAIPKTLPKCRDCGSTDIRATSSQQMLRVHGKKRLHADATCGSCGHQWWSRHPAILALSREADKERIDEAGWLEDGADA